MVDRFGDPKNVKVREKILLKQPHSNEVIPLPAYVREAQEQQ